MDIPNTTVACDGCGNDLNLLGKHLVVQVKPQRQVLVVEDLPAGDSNEVPEQNVYLGFRKGRGVAKRFHDFKCGMAWFKEREKWEVKMELVVEPEMPVVEEGEE